MSVINKMLRDLDARNQAATSASGVLPQNDSSRVAVRGRALPSKAPRQLWMPWALTAAALVAVLVAWGWWSRSAPPTGAAQAVQTPSALPQPSPPPKAVAQTSATAASSTVLATAPQPVAPTQPTAKEPAPAQRKLAAPAATVSPNSAVAQPTAAVLPTGAAEPAASGSRQLQAGRDALMQAQVLWGAGSHDAAIDLLHQALGLVERSVSSPASQAQTALLASLARELGRMLVADGRPAAALDLLTRLEPTLGKEADIWALRGNAAQRLGRHQDSVNAYAAALQLRPNEQRWMLASAVSLAALGQTAHATEMAAKASALGPVSKEVQAYLRQAGVHLGEP